MYLNLMTVTIPLLSLKPALLALAEPKASSIGTGCAAGICTANSVHSVGKADASGLLSCACTVVWKKKQWKSQRKWNSSFTSL